MNKIKILYICFIYITSITFQSCGSFCEGMMAAMMGYAGGGKSVKKTVSWAKSLYN